MKDKVDREDWIGVARAELEKADLYDELTALGRDEEVNRILEGFERKSCRLTGRTPADHTCGLQHGSPASAIIGPVTPHAQSRSSLIPSQSTPLIRCSPSCASHSSATTRPVLSILCS